MAGERSGRTMPRVGRCEYPPAEVVKCDALGPGWTTFGVGNLTRHEVGGGGDVLTQVTEGIFEEGRCNTAIVR